MPSAIGSNGSNGFAPQQTQIALSTSFSDIQLLSNFDALELQGHVFIDAASDYRASFKLSIIKNGAGVYEIAASDIAGDDYLGSPIMSFQILNNYLQCKSDVPLTGSDSAYVKFNIDTPTPALVGTSPLSVEGSNIVSEIPASRIPDLDANKIASGTLASARIPSLDASKIASGTLGVDRIPSLDASKIASGTLNADRVPSLDASKIATGTIDSARLAKSTLADATEQYLVPEYREATIDISTLSAAIKGSFTTGTLKVVRVGNVVTISAYTTLSHASLSDVYSGDGFLPDWARPSNYERTNTYTVSGQIATVMIYPTGKIRTFYIAASTGSYSARTNTLPVGITFII